MRDLKMRGMLSTDLYVKVLEMSRATERPAVAYGFTLFMASLLCSAFLGCNAPSGEQASANQFRPADDAPAKKKEVPPKEAAPIAPKETAKDNAEPAANSPLESPNSKNSAKGAKEITGPFAGKLMELRKYAKFQPRGTTQEQQVESLLKATHARLALANELAGDPAAPDEVRDEALFTSMQCYAMLMNVNEPDARENFAAVAKEIAGSKNPNLAASGKVQLFQLKFMDILALKPQDGKQLIASLTNFLESIGEHGAGLSAAVEVVQALEEMGMHSDAAQAMQLLVTHYENNPNPQLVVQVQGLQVSMLLNQLRHAEGEKVAELNKALLAQLQHLVETSKKEKEIGELCLQIGLMLEGMRDGSSALPIYELAQKSYGESKDKKLASQVKQSVENGKKRLELIGQEFKVEGALSDGSKFDWATYQGKVVLVDFWATWCGPCLEEMSNIRKYYDIYHDQGFEVIGLNLDEEPQELQEFSKTQTLAWPIVVSANEKELGIEKNPLAKKCGVDSIPFVVLIGRDGKVIGIHVRGERLGEELAKLFKEPSAKTEPQ